jgi:serine/threonine protein kinase
MSTSDNAQPEPTWGRYQVLGVLAHGGTGVVYRATNTALGWEVALKVLHERFAPTSAAARQFIEAARIAGQLQHPGIPPVHDIGALPDGRPFLVLKLIRGRTLADLLAGRPGPAHDLPRFVQVFEQVCQAVAYAHARGAVHRDLKPAHIMIGAFGEVQVIGWGSARLLGVPDADRRESPPDQGSPVCSPSEAMVGTPLYMPPEQARGGAPDCRSDVFCLGGILCTILTGRPPFTAPNVSEVVRMAAAGDMSSATDRLDGCGADAALVALAKGCLSPHPADRPPDAGAVAAQFTSYRAVAEEQVRQSEASRIAAEAVAAEQRKRRRVQLALVVAVVLLLAACFALALARGATGPALNG